MKPIVSVIMPVFNGAEHLVSAVDSIVSQTIQNLEIIIINDGSTDCSGSIIRKFGEIDSRIKIIDRSNKGLIYSLNEGFEMASGEYVARMDADDISMPNRFEEQIKCLVESDADVIGSWVELFSKYRKSIRKFPNGSQDCSNYLIFGVPFAHGSVLMKSEVSKKFKYSEKYKSAEDYAIWSSMNNAGIKMTNVQKVLYRYRVHEYQVSNRYSDQQVESSLLIRKKNIEIMCSKLKVPIETGIDILKLSFGYDLNRGEVLDMEAVDDFFRKLLMMRSSHQSASLFLDCIYPFYFRAAAIDPSASHRFKKLSAEFRVSKSTIRSMGLIFNKIFHIRYNTILYRILQKLIIF